MSSATSLPVVHITDATAADLPAVLALNEANVPHVGALDAAKLARLWGEAFALRVARLDGGRGGAGGGVAGGVVGFVLALVETAAYESPNFGWFVARYPRFVYVDRIAVAEGFRGQGVGRRLYADVEALAGRRGADDGEHVAWLTCEVNLAPPNPGSMAFHARLGFAGVGERWDEGGATGVRMLAKAVP